MTGALNPGTTFNVALATFNITANPTQMTSQTPTMIVFNFQPSFILSTFLNKVSEVIPSYDCTSSGDPAVCDQTGLTLITSSVGGGPGGGGG
jgi:hypothetical protein